MKNILNDIMDELLKGVNLDAFDEAEADDFKKTVLDDFYAKIILKAIGKISAKDKEIFLNKLRSKGDNVNGVFEVVEDFFDNPEELIVEAMVDVRTDLQQSLR